MLRLPLQHLEPSACPHFRRLKPQHACHDITLLPLGPFDSRDPDLPHDTSRYPPKGEEDQTFTTFQLFHG